MIRCRTHGLGPDPAATAFGAARLLDGDPQPLPLGRFELRDDTHRRQFFFTERLDERVIGRRHDKVHARI